MKVLHHSNLFQKDDKQKPALVRVFVWKKFKYKKELTGLFDLELGKNYDTTLIRGAC